MNVANQRVRVWQKQRGADEWVSLRRYLDGLDFSALCPAIWPLLPGVTKTGCFFASDVLDCDPGGPNSDHSEENEYDKHGRLIQTGREKQYVRWKKGKCAYIYYPGSYRGLYLMLPKVLKVRVEVKVEV